MSVAASEWVGV